MMEFFLVTFRPALGPSQPPVQWVPGPSPPRGLNDRGVKLTTSPLYRTEVKKTWSYTSTPHGDNFTLTILSA